MKHLKVFENFDKRWTPREMLKELTLHLKDAGLHVHFFEGGKTYFSSNPDYFYLEIIDDDQVFCSGKVYVGNNYEHVFKLPKGEMNADWRRSEPGSGQYDEDDQLIRKEIIKDFIEILCGFGLKEDEDFKIYGGGMGVGIAFNDEGLKKIKL